jgi:dTDP-6-deoxy-L-talose 4-dehydrogenase (NAD+)|tara:strand:- start:177 stop:1022 length:846 start_codon:yes stop_codon:yes gene_type:complete
MRKRILLTGATGFVGKQILNQLSKNDVDIVLVVRKGSDDVFHNIKNLVSIIETEDIFNETSSWWTSKCKDTDIVINAAWYAEPRAYYTSLSNIDCLRGSLNLAEGCLSAGIKKFIGIGTCAEYQTSNHPIPTNGVLKPHTIYAAAKIATFQILEQLFKSNNISFAWCRLFYLYGEGEDDRRLVPYIKKQLIRGKPAKLSSGNQVRDFMNVSVAGKIIGDISLSNQSGAINVCSGIPKTIRDHAIDVAKDYGCKSLLKFGAIEDNPLEPQYIVGIPNWKTSK